MASSTDSGLRWRQIQEIFEAALEKEPSGRQAFLARACGSDRELRAEVDGLLRADTQAGDFLERAVAGGSALLGAEGDPLAGRRILGKYEVLERIGEGGFGAVYKGLDTVLQRVVAIKVCTSRRGLLRERFLREAEIAAGLQHPNITTLHDLGFEGEIPFLVQEFLTGEDLEAKILRRQELSLEERLEILLQIARGLAYAHQQGVLHRDVKPANIRILEDGQAKIMDFGIARLLGQDSGLTQEGEALGTVGYLAPEQLRNEGLDERADLFAFGVLAYELLAYRRPFLGDSFSQVSYQVLYEEPKPLSAHVPDCPGRLEEIVRRCLSKERKRRYGHLAQVIADLEELRPAARSSASLAAGSAAPKARRRGLPAERTGERAGPGIHRRAIFAAAAATAALIALLAWLPERKGGPRVPPVSSEGLREPEPPNPGRGVPAQPGPLPGNEAPPSPSSSGGSASSRPPPGSAPVPGEVPRGPAAEPLPGLEDRPGAGGADRGGATFPPSGRPAGGPGRQAVEEPAQGSRGVAPVASEPALVGGSAAAGPAEPAGSGGAPPGRDGMAAEEAQAAGPEVPASRLQETAAPAAEGGGNGAGPQAAGGGVAPAGSTDAPASPGETEPGPESEPNDGVELFSAGAGVVPPQLIDRPAPVYPERARLRKREAQVVVAVLVDAAGKVEHALIKSGGGTGLGFEEAALEAARQATFRPARRRGTAGKMWTELSFDFFLE